MGIFVTAINLLPAGQLDGGHVFRALFGDRVRFVSYGAVILLFGLGLFYTGWLFFAILILLLGVRHPPPLNDVSPLDTKRYLVGAFAVAVLITGFVITPIATPPGAVSLDVGGLSYPGASLATPVLADVNFTVVNGDPVAHGYTLSATVENVSQRVNNTTVYLTGNSFSAWAANSTWTFQLPGGHQTTLLGGSVTLPSDQVPHARRDGWEELRGTAGRVRQHGSGHLRAGRPLRSAVLRSRRRGVRRGLRARHPALGRSTIHPELPGQASVDPHGDGEDSPPRFR